MSSNPWISFVKTLKEEKNVSYPEALILAKKLGTYKRKESNMNSVSEEVKSDVKSVKPNVKNEEVKSDVKPVKQRKAKK